jgi:hypothetical protein
VEESPLDCRTPISQANLGKHGEMGDQRAREIKPGATWQGRLQVAAKQRYAMPCPEYVCTWDGMDSSDMPASSDANQNIPDIAIFTLLQSLFFPDVPIPFLRFCLFGVGTK